MNFNILVLRLVGVYLEGWMLKIGRFFSGRFKAAEGALRVATILSVGLSVNGYAISWISWNLWAFQTGISFGVLLMTIGGLLGAVFLLITMAHLAVVGASVGVMALAVDEGSRPIPGPSLNFSEHLSSEEILKVLRNIAAVCATLVLMGLYSSFVPVYTNLVGFMGVLLAILFLMFAAFGFASTMVWLPRLQRMSMFVSVAAIIGHTLQFFALSAGTTLSSMLNPFGMKYDSASKEGAKNLAPEVASWASALSKQTGMSETAAYALFTLGWVIVILFFIGIVIPWLLRATGIIEKPLRAESAAPTASKSTGWSAAGTIVKVVVGLVLVFIAGSWVIAGMAWMIENARPENNQDTRGSVVQPAKAGVPQSVPAGELPTRWDTVGAFSLKAENDWQSTAIQLSPNECVSFELAGWTGSVLVEVGEGHGQLVVKNGGMITSIHKGELKIKVFSVTSDKDSACSVIVRKRVG